MSGHLSLSVCSSLQPIVIASKLQNVGRNHKDFMMYHPLCAAHSFHFFRFSSEPHYTSQCKLPFGWVTEKVRYRVCSLHHVAYFLNCAAFHNREIQPVGWTVCMQGFGVLWTDARTNTLLLLYHMLDPKVAATATRPALLGCHRLQQAGGCSCRLLICLLPLR